MDDVISLLRVRCFGPTFSGEDRKLLAEGPMVDGIRYRPIHARPIDVRCCNFPSKLGRREVR